MEEFRSLLSDCLDRYNNCPECNLDNCKLGLFCSHAGCDVGVCEKCLNHIQWHPSPSFSYSCKRITYHYVLRFFNRFASEIFYAMGIYKQKFLDATEYFNVVSLGCGPGSEVYGLIKNIRMRANHIHINYQGYDKNEIWEDVQNLSKEHLSQSGHTVDFYNKNLFQEYVGFENNHIDFLVLNYLLSDCQKFYKTDADRIKFIEELAQFIIYNNVRNILFNDNGFLGYPCKRLDSGVKMLRLLFRSLKRWQQNVHSMAWLFKTDSYIPQTGWKLHPHDEMVFAGITGNNLDAGATICRSKQVMGYIEPL